MPGKLLRRLPQFKGKHRIAKLFFNKLILNGTDIEVAGKYNCIYKLPNIQEIIGFEVFLNGVYEKDTIDFIVRNLPPGATMIDIGANIGTIAFPVASLRKDVRILCIEASPKVFGYLSYNKEKNGLSNCILVNKAISDEDGGKKTFFSPHNQFGKGSLSSVFASEIEMVDTITLDKLISSRNIKPVNFIKLDIEGYEYHAFKGAGELLGGPGAPDILFEFVDWAEESIENVRAGDAQRLLMEYGYKLFILPGDGNTRALLTPLTEGFAMIFATKKSLH